LAVFAASAVSAVLCMGVVAQRRWSGNVASDVTAGTEATACSPLGLEPCRSTKPLPSWDTPLFAVACAGNAALAVILVLQLCWQARCCRQPGVLASQPGQLRRRKSGQPNFGVQGEEPLLAVAVSEAADLDSKGCTYIEPSQASPEEASPEEQSPEEQSPEEQSPEEQSGLLSRLMFLWVMPLLWKGYQQGFVKKWKTFLPSVTVIARGASLLPLKKPGHVKPAIKPVIEGVRDLSGGPSVPIQSEPIAAKRKRSV